MREQLAHVPEFVEKMEAGTGIRKRWYAPDGWTTSDVALPAALPALERAGRSPGETLSISIAPAISAPPPAPPSCVPLTARWSRTNYGSRFRKDNHEGRLYCDLSPV